MKPTLARLFHDCSQSTAARNPQLSHTQKLKNTVPWRTGTGNGNRGVMNKTEAEFALILEAQQRAGEILRYEFEGITLRWADMRYTPDFVVLVPVTEFIDETVYGDDPVVTERTRFEIKLIEVKGGHIWDRDIVRFKGARAYWPEFRFEMWQLKKGQGWKRIR